MKKYFSDLGKDVTVEVEAIQREIEKLKTLTVEKLRVKNRNLKAEINVLKEVNRELEEKNSECSKLLDDQSTKFSGELAKLKLELEEVKREKEEQRNLEVKGNGVVMELT